MEALKPYSDYRDSKQPWLPKLPHHWRLAKLKHVLAERNEREHADEPLLAATQTKGVVLKSEYENRTVEAMKDLHNLKLVVPGDFVISLRSFQGGIEYARCRGIISPAYTVLYPRDASDHGYLAALFKSRPFIGNLTLYVTGIRQGQNIDYTKLSASFIPLPPPAEQAAIVRFLAALDRRVNRFVRAKRRLIELLTEQKQALISHVVTHGLNPNAKLKPSGIDWLGDVPEHWEVKSIGQLCPYISYGFTNPMPTADDGPFMLTANDIGAGEIRYDTARRTTQEAFDTLLTAKSRPIRGDVLVTKDGTLGE